MRASHAGVRRRLLWSRGARGDGRRRGGDRASTTSGRTTPDVAFRTTQVDNTVDRAELSRVVHRLIKERGVPLGQRLDVSAALPRIDARRGRVNVRRGRTTSSTPSTVRRVARAAIKRLRRPQAPARPGRRQARRRRSLGASRSARRARGCCRCSPCTTTTSRRTALGATRARRRGPLHRAVSSASAEPPHAAAARRRFCRWNFENALRRSHQTTSHL